MNSEWKLRYCQPNRLVLPTRNISWILGHTKIHFETSSRLSTADLTIRFRCRYTIDTNNRLLANVSFSAGCWRQQWRCQLISKSTPSRKPQDVQQPDPYSNARTLNYLKDLVNNTVCLIYRNWKYNVIGLLLTNIKSTTYAFVHYVLVFCAIRIWCIKLNITSQSVYAYWTTSWWTWCLQHSSS